MEPRKKTPRTIVIGLILEHAKAKGLFEHYDFVNILGDKPIVIRPKNNPPPQEAKSGMAEIISMINSNGVFNKFGIKVTPIQHTEDYEVSFPPSKEEKDIPVPPKCPELVKKHWKEFNVDLKKHITLCLELDLLRNIDANATRFLGSEFRSPVSLQTPRLVVKLPTKGKDGKDSYYDIMELLEVRPDNKGVLYDPVMQVVPFTLNGILAAPEALTNLEVRIQLVNKGVVAEEEEKVWKTAGVEAAFNKEMAQRNPEEFIKKLFELQKKNADKAALAASVIGQLDTLEPDHRNKILAFIGSKEFTPKKDEDYDFFIKSLTDRLLASMEFKAVPSANSAELNIFLGALKVFPTQEQATFLVDRWGDLNKIIGWIDESTSTQPHYAALRVELLRRDREDKVAKKPSARTSPDKQEDQKIAALEKELAHIQRELQLEDLERKLADLKKEQKQEKPKKSPKKKAGENKANKENKENINKLFDLLEKEFKSFEINENFKIKKTDRGVLVRDSTSNPPTDDDRSRLKTIWNNKIRQLPAKHVALFKDTETPAWEFIPVPTLNSGDLDRNKVFEIYQPFLQEKSAKLHTLNTAEEKGQRQDIWDYVTEASRRLRAAADLSAEDEDKVTETYRDLSSTSIPLIPISFPNQLEVYHDLFSILKLFPDENGRVMNPADNLYYSINDLILRQDVVETVSNRLAAMQTPEKFIKRLFKLQKSSRDSKVLADSVAERLNLLKPAHNNSILSYIGSEKFVLSEDASFNSFVQLLTDKLLSSMELKELTPANSAELNIFFGALKVFDAKKQADILVNRWKDLSKIINWIDTSKPQQPYYANLKKELERRKLENKKEGNREEERKKEVKIEEKGSSVLQGRDPHRVMHERQEQGASRRIEEKKQALEDKQQSSADKLKQLKDVCKSYVKLYDQRIADAKSNAKDYKKYLQEQVDFMDCQTVLDTVREQKNEEGANINIEAFKIKFLEFFLKHAKNETRGDALGKQEIDLINKMIEITGVTLEPLGEPTELSASVKGLMEEKKNAELRLAELERIALAEESESKTAVPEVDIVKADLEFELKAEGLADQFRVVIDKGNLYIRLDPGLKFKEFSAVNDAGQQNQLEKDGNYGFAFEKTKKVLQNRARSYPGDHKEPLFSKPKQINLNGSFIDVVPVNVKAYSRYLTNSEQLDWATDCASKDKLAGSRSADAIKKEEHIMEYEAKYGISAKSVEFQGDNIIFTFAQDKYDKLLAEYGNDAKTLPIDYKRSANTDRTVTLSQTTYNRIVDENKRNLQEISASFNGYSQHLYGSYHSKRHYVFLDHIKLSKKLDIIDKYVRILGSKKLTAAERLIELRKSLAKPEVIDTLSASRDGYLVWILKGIVKFLTLGQGHHCFKLWDIQGKEHVNEAKKKLNPRAHN